MAGDLQSKAVREENPMASDAIIFIPGIKGTKLVESNRANWDTIWSGIQSNFESIQDLELARTGAGSYFDERIDSIIQPVDIEELAYAEFLADLDTKKPVYIFNYDWRLSAQVNGERLHEFLNLLVAKSEASAGVETFSRFDVITHSLGNFIFRNYVHNHGFDRIHKAVLTVPPFLGSLDIVSAALLGEGWFPNVKSKFRKLVRTMPGALELLADYPGASRLEPNESHSFFNFDQWQSNVNRIRRNDPIPQKLKDALADAKVTVNSRLADLGDLPEEQRDRILIIVRDGYETMQSLSVQSRHTGVTNFVDFEKAHRTTDGDGRVPHVSSCTYADRITTLILRDAFWYREYNHGFVLKDERVQKLVGRFLFSRRRFSYSIPGGSIERVVGLTRYFHSDTGLPAWSVETD